MDDIRLFETDGDFLVLEAKDGQKYRLLIDESIRTSIKREPMQKLDAVSITPREIQEEIRNGASITELMDKSGATFEFIEKFAAPVIAELDYVVSSALSVRLTIAGDRYSDSTQVEFGEIIANRLVSSGATAVAWSAKKIETSLWHVTAKYLLGGGPGVATWSFDPRRLTLSPENETAQTLSSQETLGNDLIPKLRPVESAPVEEPNATVVIQTVRPAQPVQPIQPIQSSRPDDVIPFTARADADPLSEFSTPAAFKKNPDQLQSKKPDVASEPLSATADLLEALRRKRTARGDSDDTHLEPHPDTSNIRVIDFEPAVPEVIETQSFDSDQSQVTEAEASQDVSPSPDQDTQADLPAKPASKKGRASMPSWDEIVFGTKADD